MDWMICNSDSCFKEVGEHREDFYFTSCGHIYCFHCIDDAKEKCNLCGTVNATALSLKTPLDSRIGHYFAYPIDLMNQGMSAQKFQLESDMHSLPIFNQRRTKYQELKIALNGNIEETNKLETKCKDVKAAVYTMSKLISTDSCSSASVKMSSHRFTSPASTSSASSQYCTPSNTNISGHNQYQNNHNVNDVFKVPFSCKVPRSAKSTSGISSASSHSSTNNMNVKSNYYSYKH